MELLQGLDNEERLDMMLKDMDNMEEIQKRMLEENEMMDKFLSVFLGFFQLLLSGMLMVSLLSAPLERRIFRDPRIRSARADEDAVDGEVDWMALRSGILRSLGPPKNGGGIGGICSFQEEHEEERRREEDFEVSL